MASGWAAGLILAALLPLKLYFLIIPTALILFILMKFLFKFGFREILAVLIVFAVAVGLYRLYDNFVYKPIISYNGQEISFDGKITDISEHTGDKCFYTAKGRINGKEKAQISVYHDLFNCSINDSIKFTGTVKAFENDYLFSSLDYNRSKRLFLTCFETKSLEIIRNNSFSVKRILYDYRQTVTEFINRNLPENQSAMLCGMLLGDKSGMNTNDKTMFYRTGIGHVMAVSGLHLVLFCGIFSFLFEKIKLGKFKKFICLELIMIAFAVTSGLSDSIIRATLMMTIVNAAPLFFRKADTLNSIAIAFIVLTAVNPFAITNPSLILSVAGTFSAGVFAPYLTDKINADTFIKRQSKNALYMLLVSLCIMPFSVIFFNESSVISPLANAFLTPICMAALFIAVIASLTVFLNPVFLIKLSGLLCEIVMFAVRQTGKLEFSGINFSSEMKYISALTVLICVIAYLIFRTRKSLVISTTVSFALFIMSAVTINFVMSDKLSIAILGDKGVDVIVLSENGKAQIIDISGRKKNPQYALKFLQQGNINCVENIVIKSNAYQSMSAYDNGFSLIETENVILPNDVYLRNDMTVCDCKPDFSDYSHEKLTCGDANIQINDSRIFVKYGDFELICDNKCSDNNAVVYAEYENVFNPPKANAVIVPEYENIYGYENLITQRNVHIIAEKNGSFKIGGL